MPAKIFAAINGALFLLLLFCAINGTRREEPYYDLGALASAVVAFGCWTHRRWLVSVGGIPIMLAFAALAVMANGLPGIFNRNEAGMINLLAFGVIAWEIASIVVAGRQSASAESSPE